VDVLVSAHAELAMRIVAIIAVERAFFINIGVKNKPTHTKSITSREQVLLSSLFFPTLSGHMPKTLLAACPYSFTDSSQRSEIMYQFLRICFYFQLKVSLVSLQIRLIPCAPKLSRIAWMRLVGSFSERRV
jgi:hypothetical protein